MRRGARRSVYFGYQSNDILALYIFPFVHCSI
jgi:hypothetical protein